MLTVNAKIDIQWNFYEKKKKIIQMFYNENNEKNVF